MKNPVYCSCGTNFLQYDEDMKKEEVVDLKEEVTWLRERLGNVSTNFSRLRTAVMTVMKLRTVVMMVNSKTRKGLKRTIQEVKEDSTMLKTDMSIMIKRKT